jgi:hypothetical protein
MTLTAETLYFDDAVVSGRCGPVVVNVWRGKARGSKVFPALRPAIEQTAADHPNGIGLLSIATPTTRMPDLEMRKAMNAQLSAYAPQMRAAHQVIESSGFTGTVLWNFARAVLVACRFDGRISNDLEKGVAVMAQAFPEHPSLTSVLLAGVEHWRGLPRRVR